MEQPSAPTVENVVREEIASDIVRFEADIDRIDKRTAELMAERDALPTTGMDDEPAEEELMLTRRIQSGLDQSILLAQKISRLRHPSEYEARVAKKEQTHTRIHKLRRNHSMSKETAKDQGVPEVYLGETGNFKIGMDARLKSDLVLSALGLITKEEPGQSLNIFTEKEALALLEKRGWNHFLDRKREIEESKSAAKVKTAAEREERERVKAEAKAVKDAKKAEEKAAKDAAKAEAKGNDSTKTSGGAGGVSKTEQARMQREAKAAEAEAANAS